MPLPNPPDPDPNDPDAEVGMFPDGFTFTSAAGTNQHILLHDLAARWTNLNTRWDTMKDFRVMCLKYFSPLSRSTFPQLPKKFFEIYADPRLSVAALRMNALVIPQHPEHIDIDWCGPAGTNWWPGEVDGDQLRQNLVLGLLNYLEDSLGVPQSVPDAEKWEWHGVKSTPWNDLRSKQRDPSVASKDVFLEWRLVKNATQPLTIQIATGPATGDIFRIITPRPADTTAISLTP